MCFTWSVCVLLFSVFYFSFGQLDWTPADFFAEVRSIVPDSFLLVPGVGAQGGSLADVCRYGMNDQVGLLVNSARGIIYASRKEDFAEQARAEALKLQQEMASYLG